MDRGEREDEEDPERALDLLGVDRSRTAGRRLPRILVPAGHASKPSSIAEANGELALIEYRKEDPDIPIAPTHRMSVAEAKIKSMLSLK
jgi:hypothetical protein